MRKTSNNAEKDTGDRRAPSTLSPLTGHSDASPLTDDEKPIKCTKYQKEAGRPKKSRIIVRRRSSSTSAVFVAKNQVAGKKKKGATRYNTFRWGHLCLFLLLVWSESCGRTDASKLLGAETVKRCRDGGSFNGNVSILWKEISEADKAAFSDWTEEEQREYLIKLARPQAEEKKEVLASKRKTSRAATRVQPKRGVVGKAKKWSPLSPQFFIL
jgi:hypothetical protein